MSVRDQALRIARNEGIRKLASKGTNYFRRQITGGISSRPTTQMFAGLFNPIFNRQFKNKYGEGTNIMNEDWDNLVLLDACRYDDFRDIHPFSGRLEYRISLGQDSRQFMIGNFIGNEYYDTIYVTANPHFKNSAEDVFYKLNFKPLDCWNEELKCVLPESVTQAALQTYQKNPNKRLIIHYMQPHFPPIGSLRNELSKKYNMEEIQLMEAVASGKVSVNKAREAYLENLEIVLGEVETLLESLEGKTVISSDHGEMFGEKPYPIIGDLYEHYNHPKTIKLCKVPWFISDEQSNRREIQESSPDAKSNIKNNVEDQLESLGYK